MELKDLKPSPVEMSREDLLALISGIQDSRLVSKKKPRKKTPAKPGKLHVWRHNQLGLGGDAMPTLEIAWCGKSRELSKRKPRIKHPNKITKKDVPDLCKACIKAGRKESPDFLNSILED